MEKKSERKNLNCKVSQTKFCCCCRILQTNAPVDFVVFSTGFDSSSATDILPDSLLKAMDFDGGTWLPLLLDRSTFHPALPNAAFINFYRNPHWPAAELQARWAAQIFAGRLEAPSLVEMRHGIYKSKALRDSQPRAQYPYFNRVA